MKASPDQSLWFYVEELVFRRGNTVDHTLTDIAALPSDQEFESQIRMLRVGRYFHRFDDQPLSQPALGIFIGFLLKLLFLSFDFLLGLIVLLSRSIHLMQNLLNKRQNRGSHNPTSES